MRQSSVDTDMLRILAELVSAEVDFVIIGSFAAVLEGVSLIASDVDIVYRRTHENAERLLTALALDRLDAHFMGDITDLMGRGDFHLITKHGKLDLLGEISGERSYEDLLPHSIEVCEAGLRLWVLDLPMQIKIKEEFGRPNDIAALPLLRAALMQRGHI